RVGEGPGHAHRAPTHCVRGGGIELGGAQRRAVDDVRGVGPGDRRRARGWRSVEFDDPPFLLALRVDTVADDRLAVGGYGARRSQRPPGERGAQTIIGSQYLLEILDATGLIPNECSGAGARVSASSASTCWWTHLTNNCRSVS